MPVPGWAWGLVALLVLASSLRMIADVAEYRTGFTVRRVALVRIDLEDDQIARDLERLKAVKKRRADAASEYFSQKRFWSPHLLRLPLQ